MSVSLAPSNKYTMIKEFRDELKGLKTILNDIKKLKLLREKEINEIKNETKRKSNMLDDETSDISEKLDVNLTTLVLRCRFWKRELGLKSELKGELSLSARERINETKRLKEEVKNNKDNLLNHLLDGETKTFKLLTDSEYKKMKHYLVLQY